MINTKFNVMKKKTVMPFEYLELPNEDVLAFEDMMSLVGGGAGEGCGCGCYEGKGCGCGCGCDGEQKPS